MRSNWKSIVFEDKKFSKQELVKKSTNYLFLNDLAVFLKINKKNIFKININEKISEQKFKVYSSYLLDDSQVQREMSIWKKFKVILYQKIDQPYRVNIYNGRTLASILINELKHGGRYGEFIFTKGSKVIKGKGKINKK